MERLIFVLGTGLRTLQGPLHLPLKTLVGRYYYAQFRKVNLTSSAKCHWRMYLSHWIPEPKQIDISGPQLPVSYS